MKKLGLGCLSFIALIIIVIVVAIVIRNNRLDAKIQSEVQAVEQAFDNSQSDETRQTLVGSDANVEKKHESGPMNLEKTIRIFHILNDGMAKSSNMHEYLKFLATQDYRGVPKEVLDAKRKLIPYYVCIRKAEEDLDEAEYGQKQLCIIYKLKAICSWIFDLLQE